MRYRLATLSLAAVLCVLPGLMTTMPAAPAPAPETERAKPPAIYALVYVGLAKNDPDNAKRIAAALKDLRGFGARAAVRDPEVKALSIVQDKDPKGKTRSIVVEGKEHRLSWIERDEWAERMTRTANLDGTAVVRVWFTDGSPGEQVLIVNAIARTYVENQQETHRDGLKGLEECKLRFKGQQEAAGAKVTEEDEKVFQRQEWAIKHLPYVIEWADLPDKP
jgi:hypothetical protein